MFVRIVAACTAVCLSVATLYAQELNPAPVRVTAEQLRELTQRAHAYEAELRKELIEDHPRLRELPNIEAWYLVQRNGTIKLHRGQAHQRHVRQWELLRRVVDVPIEKVYTTFVVYRDLPKTDATQITLGVTVNTVRNPRQFGIAINQWAYTVIRKGPETPIMALILGTMIHEYVGHAKMNPNGLVGTTENGCFKDISRVGHILKRFSETFWPHCALSRPRPAYDPRQFVSEHAFLSAEEDFAETAKMFVFCNKPQRRTNPIAQRLLFLWEIPELVAYRAGVRKRVDKTVMHVSTAIARCA